MLSDRPNLFVFLRSKASVTWCISTPDLTKDQRVAQFQLCAELKPRKASGEVNLIIKNNRIVTKSSHSTTAGVLSSTAASPSSLGATTVARPLSA